MQNHEKIIRSKTMKNLKKILSIALVLILALSFAACTNQININVSCDDKFADALAKAGSAGTASVPVQATTQPAQTEAPTTQPAGDSGEQTTQAPAEKPDEGKKGGELSASSSKEEVVAKYVEIYNKTKAQGTLTGKTKTTCTALAIEGKENSLVKKVADLAVGGEGTSPLPPSRDDNPGLECAVKPDDIEKYQFTDNGDGTATIRLDVKETTNSRRFQDPAGDMLDVMEDLAGTLASVSAVSFAEGDVNSNVTLVSTGYCEVTYDTSTNLITKGIYVLYTDADIQHVNVKPFVSDKHGTASFEYTVELPA